MLKKICYRLDDLLKLIPDFHVANIEGVHETEDDQWSGKYNYLVSRDDIVKVYSYHSLWTSTRIHFADGKSIWLQGDNVNVDDMEALRLSRNTIISPKIYINDNYVEARQELQTWLKNVGVTPESLEPIMEGFDVASTIEYPGVATPVYKEGHWWSSSETLVLDEFEIKTALESIEDPLLRKKIENILYARVFKRHY